MFLAGEESRGTGREGEEEGRRGGRFRGSANPEANHHPVAAGQGRGTQLNNAPLRLHGQLSRHIKLAKLICFS